MAAIVRPKYCDLSFIIVVYLLLGIIAGVDSRIECNNNWDCRDDQGPFFHSGFNPHACWPTTYKVAKFGVRTTTSGQFTTVVPAAVTTTLRDLIVNNFIMFDLSLGPDQFARNTGWSENGDDFYWASTEHEKWYADISKNDPTNITVYAMKYNGRNLFGWLHVVLQGAGSLDKVIIQLETEENQGATAGSIIHLPITGGCKHVGVGQTPRHDYRPCSTATDPFPEVHQTFGRRWFTEFSNVYRFNVKISFPLCSIYYDKNPIYFRAYVMKREGLSLPTQKRIALKEYVFGSADPAPPFNSTPDCSQQISTTIPWVQSVASTDSLDVKLYRWPCQATLYTQRVGWGGRCNLGFDPNYSGRKQDHDVSTTFRYHCRRRRAAFLPLGKRWNNYNDDVFTDPSPEKWSSMYPEISLYYQQVQDVIDKQCANNCTSIYNLLQMKGLDASTDIAIYVWGGRQAHGMLMAIACLFVYPVSNFMTRYFKGTFMNSRVVVNLHVWYSVHLYAIFTAGTLLVVSLGIAIYARKFFGYSDTAAGKTHVSMGYFALFFFFADFVYMGWRCGEEEGRNCAILLHFLLGAGFYFTSLVAIITSIYVPGSPGSLKDEQKNNLDTGSFILLALVVKLWPIFECVIHVLATLQMCRTDRKSAVLRDWAFLLVPIPRVAAGERQDEDGTAYRVCLLRVFVLCSLGATCIALFAIGTSQPRGHLMGPMTLTHVDGRFTDEYINTVQEFPDIV